MKVRSKCLPYLSLPTSDPQPLTSLSLILITSPLPPDLPRVDGVQVGWCRATSQLIWVLFPHPLFFSSRPSFHYPWSSKPQSSCPVWHVAASWELWIESNSSPTQAGLLNCSSEKCILIVVLLFHREKDEDRVERFMMWHIFSQSYKTEVDAMYLNFPGNILF